MISSFKNAWRWLRGTSKKVVQEQNSDPYTDTLRSSGSKSAIILVHGFGGTARDTWSVFGDQLIKDKRLTDWDVHSIGYPTKMSFDLPLWKSSPDITTAARGLCTKLGSTAFKKYDCFAIVAHSMGGLVVQKALLDDPNVRSRTSHFIMFGTPSNGLIKALIGRPFKLQLNDMGARSAFIESIRSDWKSQFADALPFLFKTVAGDQDAFVPESSSLRPFDVEHQHVVHGDHLGIVRPGSITDLSYDVLYRLLVGDAPPHSQNDTARLAVERKEFTRAIEILWPGRNGLDEEAAVTLALALESAGRSKDAMTLMENHHGHEGRLDATGVLAGRLKRRWLVERQQADYDRSLALYIEGAEHAGETNDDKLLYYLAINAAFLITIVGRKGTAAPQKAIEWTEIAIAAWERTPLNDGWHHATLGECHMILGNLELATEQYRKAVKLASSVRERHSMYVQASAIAERMFGEAGQSELDDAFGIDNGLER